MTRNWEEFIDLRRGEDFIEREGNAKNIKKRKSERKSPVSRSEKIKRKGEKKRRNLELCTYETRDKKPVKGLDAKIKVENEEGKRSGRPRIKPSKKRYDSRKPDKYENTTKKGTIK